MDARHHGKVVRGKFVPSVPDAFRLAFCALEGKEVWVVVKKHTNARTNQQNKYYWGVVVKLVSETTGFTTDEAHDALRMKFLRIRGEKLETVKSTTDLTTTEFEEYMTTVRQWAISELGCYIPEPNEVEF